MQLTKYHALGNDYLVLDPARASLPDAEGIRKICHRNFGLGSDGILYGPLPSQSARFALQIWNPDGSEAEKSGNGLRIFCRYLLDCGKVRTGESFTIETKGGIVRAQIASNGAQIEVQMGHARFNSGEIPVTGHEREVLGETMALAGKAYTFCAVTVGNPHVVLPLEHISKELACELGPQIENDIARFPNRTNVQLLKVLDRNTIQIEIWERGAGYTLASGSSSCAAAAVAHKLGAVDAELTVRCPGGDIRIRIDPAFALTMTGPATAVGTYTMAPSVLTQHLPKGY